MWLIMPLRSPFSTLPVPNVALHRHFFEHFYTHGDKIALVNDEDGKQYTYNEVMDLSKRVASGLVKLGVQKGDVFALYSFNSPELVIMMWAVFATGAVVTSINPLNTTSELQDQLEDSGAKIVYTSNDLLAQTKKAVASMTTIKKIVVERDHDETSTNITFEKLCLDNRSCWRDLEDMEFNPMKDVVILLYSSGTTGRPKGVPLTHHNVLWNAVQQRHPDITGPWNEVCALVISPLYHAYAFAVFVCGYMGQGAKHIVQKKFDAAELLKAVELHKVTHLYLTSSMAVRLAKSADTGNYNITSLKHVYSAGAPLNKETAAAFLAKMGLSEIKQVYGMTEASLLSVHHQKQTTPKGAVGLIPPGLEACIVDSKGTHLKCHEEGELCVRGPQIMKEYLHRPEATQKAIDSDGWLHTGDIAYYDGDNYVYLVDRMKDIFKVYNNQVSPSQLEGVLFLHPAVSDVGVIGIPDAIAMHKPKAFVVKQPGAVVTEKELCDHVAGVAAPYKWLTGGVKFVPEIPRLPSGKIIRHKLQELGSTNNANQ